MENTSENYTSWDQIQRHIKQNEKLKTSPMRESITKLMDEIEEILDGPNDTWEQEIYLKKKKELIKLISILNSNDHLELKAS